MTSYVKVDGSWTSVLRPSVKIVDVWYPAKAVYVKVGSAWQLSYEYDVTPSAAPELSLEIIDGRFIKVGARLPGISNDPDLSMIRVLVSRTGQPSTYNGSGFLASSDKDYPGESWSDWEYQTSKRPDSSLWTYKQYPYNPDSNTNLPGDKFYWFAAWSKDKNENWSQGTFTKIYKPKDGNTRDSVVTKEANFSASFAGSAQNNGTGYVPGDLTQSDSPRWNGFWFYQNKITDSVGDQGTPTIKSARVRVSRSDDGGQPTANVNLFWHTARTPEEMPVPNASRFNITTVGTINKGETKWFDLPNSFLSHLDTQTNGLGLAYGIQASDYLVAKGLGLDQRSGELNVVWEEAL